jgi:hypothetical protein
MDANIVRYDDWMRRNEDCTEFEFVSLNIESAEVNTMGVTIYASLTCKNKATNGIVSGIVEYKTVDGVNLLNPISDDLHFVFAHNKEINSKCLEIIYETKTGGKKSFS